MLDRSLNSRRSLPNPKLMKATIGSLHLEERDGEGGSVTDSLQCPKVVLLKKP